MPFEQQPRLCVGKSLRRVDCTRGAWSIEGGARREGMALMVGGGLFGRKNLIPHVAPYLAAVSWAEGVVWGELKAPSLGCQGRGGQGTSQRERLGGEVGQRRHAAGEGARGGERRSRRIRRGDEWLGHLSGLFGRIRRLGQSLVRQRSAASWAGRTGMVPHKIHGRIKVYGGRF